MHTVMVLGIMGIMGIILQLRTITEAMDMVGILVLAAGLNEIMVLVTHAAEEGTFRGNVLTIAM